MSNTTSPHEGLIEWYQLRTLIRDLGLNYSCKIGTPSPIKIEIGIGCGYDAYEVRRRLDDAKISYVNQEEILVDWPQKRMNRVHSTNPGP